MGYVKGHIRRTSKGIKYVGGHFRRPRLMTGFGLRWSPKAAKGCLVVLLAVGGLIVFSIMLVAWMLTGPLQASAAVEEHPWAITLTLAEFAGKGQLNLNA